MPPRRATPARATTPARTTRSSSRAPGPLPVIDTKPSHAYGSRGKASLFSQVTASHAAIDDAFDQSRDEMPPPPKPLSHAKQQSSSPQVAAQPTGPASVGVHASDFGEMRPGTALNNTGYQAAAATAAADVVPRPSRLASSRPVRSPTPEPSGLRVFLPTVSRFMTTWQFWVLFLAISSYTTFAWMSMVTIACSRVTPTATVDTSGEKFCYYAGKAIGYDQHVFTQTVMDRQVEWNKAVVFLVDRLNTTLSNLEDGHNALSTQVGLLDETVAEIKSALPNMVVVIDKDGETIIPENFWLALADKMKSEEGTQLWQGFLEANDAKIREIAFETSETQFDGMVATQKVISRDDFQVALVANNQLMEQEFNETLRTFQTAVLQQARDAAKDVVEDIFESTHLAKGQISALAYSNLVVNMDQRLRETNYFSHGLGAVVQPSYTSPTWREPSFAQMLGRWAWKGLGTLTSVVKPQLSVNPNTAALTEWSENGDCWCTDSPNNADVKLQIAVRVPFNVYPRTFIIEHIPASGTRDIAAAPKDFEVWLKMGSKEDADKLEQALKDRKYGFSSKFCGDPPRSSTSSINTVDNGTWVCAMHGRYDIHGLNYIQQFLFPASPWDIGLETWTVVLKVVDNWGADHTCLYRIRLNADEVDFINHRID